MVLDKNEIELVYPFKNRNKNFSKTTHKILEKTFRKFNIQNINFLEKVNTFKLEEKNYENFKKFIKNLSYLDLKKIQLENSLKKIIFEIKENLESISNIKNKDNVLNQEIFSSVDKKINNLCEDLNTLMPLEIIQMKIKDSLTDNNSNKNASKRKI